jgi:type I restriction enzyme S subunit
VSINRDGERIPVSSSDRESRAKIYDYYGASGVIDKIDGYLFEKTLLLIGEDGANLINRSTPIAFLAHGKYWVNNHAHVIDATHRKLLDYLALFINSISLRPYVTGTAQPKMNQAKLNSILVAVPPLAEQSRIVTRVEELMQLCDALETSGQLEAQQHAQLVNTLLGTLTQSETPEALADNWQRIATHFDVLLDRPEAVGTLEQTILQLAVRGLLVPQDSTDESASVLLQKIRTEKDRLIAQGKIKRDKPLPPITEEEKPFELPQGWEWARLGDVGVTQTGGTPNKNDPEHFGSDIPFIKPGDIYPERVDYQNEGLSLLGAESLGRTAEAGSILMVCIGTIGKSNLIDRSCSFNQQINSVTPILILPEYLLAVLRSPYFQDEAWARSSSTTISILNKGKWESIPIPVPPLQEQSRILSRFEDCQRFNRELKIMLTEAIELSCKISTAIVSVGAA